MTGSTNAVVLDVQCGANNPNRKACSRSWYAQEIYLAIALRRDGWRTYKSLSNKIRSSLVFVIVLIGTGLTLTEDTNCSVSNCKLKILWCRRWRMNLLFRVEHFQSIDLLRMGYKIMFAAGDYVETHSIT